jgi:prepilin peptidase CpaA
MLEAAILIIFPFAMAYAAMSDFLTMTIANRISLILVVSFTVLAPLTGMVWTDYGMHFAAMLTVLTICFALFATGTMGGGDAKLMASSALWIGWNMQLVEYFLAGSLLGGVVTMMILHYRGSSVAVFGNRIEFLRKYDDPKGKVPYGIALGLAGLLIFPETELAQWVISRLAI